MNGWMTTVFRAVSTKKYQFYARIGLFFLKKVNKKRVKKGFDPLLSSFDEDRYFRDLSDR